MKSFQEKIFCNQQSMPLCGFWRQNIVKTMKIIGLIPHRYDSNSRDLTKLSGRYLIEYAVRVLNSSCIDETILYASNSQFLNYIGENLDVTFLQRPDFLDEDCITIEEILASFIEDVACDIIVYLHPYSPFLKKETVNRCVQVIKDRIHDSAFSAKSYKKLAWFGGKPINFELTHNTPKLKDLEPVIFEHGLLYVIDVATFKRNHSRIGDNPYIAVIDNFEGHEINDMNDFVTAELIINSGMHKVF